MMTQEKLYHTTEYWLDRAQYDIFRAVHTYMEEKGLNQTALVKELGAVNQK
ncbi:MAG: hypothetical protein WBB45_00785 [Cyclobacteriaceae bacterium]